MNTPPPTGDQHVLRYGEQVAVVTSVAASLREYRVGDRDVVLPFPADGTTNRSDMFSPVSSGNAHNVVSASRAELAWTVHIAGTPENASHTGTVRSCG